MNEGGGQFTMIALFSLVFWRANGLSYGPPRFVSGLHSIHTYHQQSRSPGEAIFIFNKLIFGLTESRSSLSVARPKTQNTLRVYIFSTFGTVR